MTQHDHLDPDSISASPQGNRIEDEILPPHWQEATITANGIRQHYYRTGGEKPSLILLHGFTENGMCWSRVAKALEHDYDLILLDARGHGLSSGPETGYSQELLTQDVAALIHELRLSSPVLFGHSNGALTAAQIASTFPELVHAIILEDPPWSESPTLLSMPTEGSEPWLGFTAWYSTWIAWHKALRTQTPEERLASSRQFLPPGAYDWPHEELMTHLEAQAQFNLDVLNLTPLFPTPTPWRATVERITCPILLLAGAPQRGAILTRQEAQNIAATWRKGQLVSFEETGHMMHHEMHGEAFANLIRTVKAFLNEEETSRPAE